MQMTSSMMLRMNLMTLINNGISGLSSALVAFVVAYSRALLNV